MIAAKHILIVDAHDILREALRIYLTEEGYRVSVAGDGQEFRRIIARETIDLTILDIMLPGEDGLSLTRHLRDRYCCGIIMATARGDLTDRIVGLEVGADDYLIKPFERRELLARIRSVLRRLEGRVHEAAPPSADQEVARFAGWTLDIGARRLVDESGEIVDLTSGEYSLLSAFISGAGRVLSREHLLRCVHNRDWDYFDRSIDVLVTRLRRKIECKPRHPAIIKTVRGAGYMLTTQVSRAAF